MSQAGSNGSGGSGSSITFIGDVGAGATASGGIININGIGAVVSTTSNQIYITVSSAGFTWNSVTSVSPTNPIQIVKENGYICNGSSLVTFLLPLSPSIGDSFIIISNTSRFEITENASQQMQIGNLQTTAGSGSITSTASGDKIELTYVASNLFIVTTIQGNLTIM